MIQKTDTRSLLASSLLELSKNKPVEKISVTDIAKNCSLSRESFYYHFKDKYDLVAWIFIDHANRVMGQYSGEEPWAKSVAKFLRFFSEHLFFFKTAMLDENTNGFYHSLFQYTISVMESSVMERFPHMQVADELRFQLRFYAYGAINSAKVWILNQCPESPEELGQRFASSMSPMLQTLFP